MDQSHKTITVNSWWLHQLEKRYVFRIYIYMLVQLVNIDKKLTMTMIP